MMLRAIRKHKKAAKIPLIILVVVLAAGLVLPLWYGSLPTVNNTQVGSQNGSSNELQNLRSNIRQYEQALKTNPEDFNIVVTLANSQYDLGDRYFGLKNYEEGEKFFKAAVSSYQKALELQPENINVRVDLATAAFYSGQNDLAEEHFKKAIEQDSKFLNARMNYGIFLKNVRNDNQGAIAQWQAALDAKPAPEAAKTFKDLIKNAGN